MDASRSRRTATFLTALALAAGGVAGCGESDVDQGFDRATDEATEATEDAGQAIDEATGTVAEDAEQAAQEAAKAAEEAAQDAENAVE